MSALDKNKQGLEGGGGLDSNLYFQPKAYLLIREKLVDYEKPFFPKNLLPF